MRGVCLVGRRRIEMDGGRKGRGRFGRCNEVLFEQGPFVFDSQLEPRRSRSLRAEKEKKLSIDTAHTLLAPRAKPLTCHSPV